MTNCPTVDQAPANLTEVILTLNPHIYTPPLSDPTREESVEHIRSIDDAIELCKELLRLDATRRSTAKAALGHKFFSKAEGYEPELEHPILTGVDGKCGHLHSVEGGKRTYHFSPRASLGARKADG
jgi:cell division control protein 7